MPISSAVKPARGERVGLPVCGVVAAHVEGAGVGPGPGRVERVRRAGLRGLVAAAVAHEEDAAEAVGGEALAGFGEKRGQGVFGDGDGAGPLHVAGGGGRGVAFGDVSDDGGDEGVAEVARRCVRR